MTKRLLLLLVSLGFFSFLIADEENPAAGESAAEQVEAGDAEDDAEPEEVVVVGSRIARNEYDVAQPVTIIYGEEYDNRGYTNAADALFDVPGIGVTNSLTSGSGGNFGNQSTLSVGQSLANNFGLGSGRTLVLINGRRFVGSTSPFGSGGGGNAVDINNIPSQMIDRVEILNAGGSAIYGSDAIAGVINYVLKDNYEGSNASLVYDDFATSDQVIRDLFTPDVNNIHIDDKKLYNRIHSYVKEVNPSQLNKLKLKKTKGYIFDDHKNDEQIKKTLNKKVWLKSGGHLVIEHTEAMVVIDVNSGRFIGKKDHEQNSLKINIEFFSKLNIAITANNIVKGSG